MGNTGNMGSFDKIVNLEEVSAEVLPAEVLVLLSKYAQAMRKHTGLVIKISSLNVFKHVHRTHKLTQHPSVRKLHLELLCLVNSHIKAGTMHTSHERELIAKSRESDSVELLMPQPQEKFFNGTSRNAANREQSNI